MPKIESLVADIFSLFDTEERELFNPKLFQEFGGNLQQTFQDRFNIVRDGGKRLRMSNIGKKDRQLWYEMNRVAEREGFSPQTLVKFSYGDIIEQMMLLYAKMAGHEVTQEQAEVEIDGIKGHIDCIIDGVVVDVKSASSFSFQKFESGALLEPGNDPFGYVAQLAGYVEALTPGKDGAFLAVDKTLGKICLLVVPAAVLQAFNVRKRIEHIKQVVASPEIPERCYEDVPDGKSGNRKLATGCSYCGDRFHCWPGLQTFYYSTGPRYLTKVVKQPLVKDFPE